MFARTRWMLFALLVAVAVALAAPAAAAARTSLDQRARMQRAVIRHDLSTLRWFRNHPLRGLSGLRPLRQMVLMRRREQVVLHAAAQLAWTQAELAETQAAIRLRDERRAAARARRKAREARKAAAKARADAEASLMAQIPHYDQWLCIHRYEGSWTDGGAPYYGGLQMDYGFMQTYGGEYLREYGTADRWPPLVQMLVAERAYASGRGFYPWPTTARLCGLL